MSQEEKRVRGKNFSEKEKEIVIYLTEKYSSILENKKTDAATVREKNETWEIVAEEFSGLAGIKRTSLQIYNYYKNLKKKLRQSVNRNCSERYEAEDGSADTNKVTEDEERLLGMLQPQLEILSGSFESTATIHEASTSVPLKIIKKEADVKEKISKIRESKKHYSEEKLKMKQEKHALRIKILETELKSKELDRQIRETKLSILKKKESLL